MKDLSCYSWNKEERHEGHAQQSSNVIYLGMFLEALTEICLWPFWVVDRSAVHHFKEVSFYFHKSVIKSYQMDRHACNFFLLFYKHFDVSGALNK